MSKYYFNLAGQPDDSVGIECESLKEARATAVGFMASNLHHNPEYLDEGHWRVDVVDEQRTLLFKIVVAMVDAPGASTLRTRPHQA